MTIALAATWDPRLDVPLLRERLPQLAEVYSALVVAVRPEGMERLREFPSHSHLALFAMPQRGWGRYLAIQTALASAPDFVHSVDLDHLLYWVTHRPEEWRAGIAAMPEAGCLIFGRSARAWQTYPQVIRQTEQIFNDVFSHLLGQPIDFGLGNRRYSRRAAEHIVAHSAPGRWGDAEWPLRLHRAGYAVAYRAVDGIDWIPSAAGVDYMVDAAARQQIADAYDADVAHWATRVRIAQQIVREGLEAPAAGDPR